jgi:hypothetical protein
MSAFFNFSGIFRVLKFLLAGRFIKGWQKIRLLLVASKNYGL